MAVATAITVQSRPEHPAGACVCGDTGVVIEGGRLQLCICNVTATARRRNAFRMFGALRFGRSRLGMRSVDELAVAPSEERDETIARMESVARFFEFNGLDELLAGTGEPIDGFDEIAVRCWSDTVQALRGNRRDAGKAVA